MVCVTSIGPQVLLVIAEAAALVLKCDDLKQVAAMPQLAYSNSDKNRPYGSFPKLGDPNIDPDIL